MPTLIKLSDTTKALVSQFQLAQPGSDLDLKLFQSSEIKIEALINWLMIENKTTESVFILESLRASLLTDIVQSIPGTLYKPKHADNEAWGKKELYVGIAIAGTLFLGCEGFDGITSILGVFALPQAIVLAGGILFSILSIAVFYGFDLLEIASNLGVSFSESRNVLDIYLQQLDQITLIQKKLAKINLNGTLKSDEDLEESLLLIAALRAQLDSLEKTRQKFEAALNNQGLQAAKMVLALVTGLMFFAGGYFAGQAVALTIAAAIVGSAVAATAWPIILTAIVIASSAFMVYWFLERPGVQNLLGRIMGLDQEKVEKFSNEKGIDAIREELNVVETNINAVRNGQKPVQPQATSTEAKEIKTEIETKIANSTVITDTSKIRRTQSAHNFFGGKVAVFQPTSSNYMALS